MNKVCNHCQVEKPIDMFGKQAETNDGKRASCLKCTRIASNISAAKYKTKRKNQKLIFDYGITLEEFNILLDRQDNMCGICNKDFVNERDKCVDHCHKTKKVRGILCRKCNLGLGHFNDNINSLKKAIGYLNGDG